MYFCICLLNLFHLPSYELPVPSLNVSEESGLNSLTDLLTSFIPSLVAFEISSIVLSLPRNYIDHPLYKLITR